MSTLLVRAHAKINLALAVSPPEPAGAERPGWHRIASWFAPIELHDELHLTRLGDDAGGRCELMIRWADDAPRASAIDWPIEKDLAFRAHALLQERVGRPLSVRCEMVKRTPVGGGLGGGSSDAAAMLRGLNRLFELGLSADDLRAVGVRLGSDVGFFIDDDRPDDAEFRDAPRAAIVSNFGDAIERIETPAEPLLLIVPSFGCPTAAVYKAFDGTGPGPMQEELVRGMAAMAAAEGMIPADELFNDLAEPACIVEPRLREVISRVLLPTKLPVYVTGSGSTLFVPFGVDDEDAINRLGDLAEQNLAPTREDGLGVVVAPTRIVG